MHFILLFFKNGCLLEKSQSIKGTNKSGRSCSRKKTSCKILTTAYRNFRALQAIYFVQQSLFHSAATKVSLRLTDLKYGHHHHTRASKGILGFH